MKHCFRCYCAANPQEPCIRQGRSYAELKKALAYARKKAQEGLYIELRDDFQPRSNQLIGYGLEGRITLRNETIEEIQE